MKKESITLDKWDSQILLLSKGWFEKELQDLGKTRLDALKALWTDRCYVKLEHVNLRYIVAEMVEMMTKFDMINEDTVTDLLIAGLTFKPDFNRYGFKRDSEISREEDLINSLLDKMSIVQCKEGENNVYTDLIILEEKYTSFLNVYTRVEDEDIQVYKNT